MKENTENVAGAVQIYSTRLFSFGLKGKQALQDFQQFVFEVKLSSRIQQDEQKVGFNCSNHSRAGFQKMGFIISRFFLFFTAFVV